MLSREIDKRDTELFADFEMFYYREWPKERRIGGRAAWLSYRRMRAKSYTHAEIMDGLRRWKAHWRETPARFIPHPTTWLNEGRFLDAPPTGARARPRDDVNHVMGLG